MKSHNIHNFFSLTSIINHRTSSSSSLIKTGTQVYFQIQYTVTQYSEFEQYFDYAKLYRSNLKKLYNIKDFFTKLYSCKNTLITMYEVASKLFKKHIILLTTMRKSLPSILTTVINSVDQYALYLYSSWTVLIRPA